MDYQSKVNYYGILSKYSLCIDCSEIRIVQLVQAVRIDYIIQIVDTKLYEKLKVFSEHFV